MQYSARAATRVRKPMPTASPACAKENGHLHAGVHSLRVSKGKITEAADRSSLPLPPELRQRAPSRFERHHEGTPAQWLAHRLHDTSQAVARCPIYCYG